jgi:hypothetical protein
MQEYLASDMLSPSPYSPDAAPTNCYMFPRMKALLKQHMFHGAKMLEELVVAVIKEVAGKSLQAC